MRTIVFSILGVWLTFGFTTQAVAITIADGAATVTSDDYANANATAIGSNGSGTATWRSFAAFQVSDILANEGLTLVDLATTPFELSFDAQSGTTLSAGAYRADYLGFYADSMFPATGQGFAPTLPDWHGLYTDYNTGTEINSGVSDVNGAQSLTIGNFFLTGVTESDPDDYVVLGVRYDEPQAAGTGQFLENFSLAALQQVSVPEPSTAVLLVLGVAICGRTRRRCRVAFRS